MKPASQRTPGIRRVAIVLFQLFIILCLIDGFLDLMSPTLSYGRKILLSHMNSLWTEPEQPNINTRDDGLRLNGHRPPRNPTSSIWMLGASTTLGYGVKDNQTLPSYLEQDLKHTQVKNYGAFSQKISGNVLRWYSLKKEHHTPNLVIISGASTDIYLNCTNIDSHFHSNNILHFLYDKIINILTRNALNCAAKDTRALTVQKTILALQGAVAYARTLGTPFYVVYLPTPYDANTNVDNLMGNTEFRDHMDDIQLAYQQYHTALIKLHIPELIDLYGALPTDKPYFLDPTGHFSAAANKILASKIAAHIHNTSQTENR